MAAGRAAFPLGIETHKPYGYRCSILDAEARSARILSPPQTGSVSLPRCRWGAGAQQGSRSCTVRKGKRSGPHKPETDVSGNFSGPVARPPCFFNRKGRRGAKNFSTCGKTLKANPRTRKVIPQSPDPPSRCCGLIEACRRNYIMCCRRPACFQRQGERLTTPMGTLRFPGRRKTFLPSPLPRGAYNPAMQPPNRSVRGPYSRSTSPIRHGAREFYERSRPDREARGRKGFDFRLGRLYKIGRSI